MSATTLLGIVFIVVGALVLIVELNTLTIYLLAVAIGLFAAGGLALAGGNMSLDFALLAIILVLAIPAAHWWRGKLKNRAADEVSNNDAGQPVVIVNSSPQQIRVSYRGTDWNAQLAKPTDALPEAGEQYYIYKRAGNLLIIADEQISRA